MLHCLTLDLRDDPASITAYDAAHRAVPIAVEAHLRQAGVRSLRLFRLGTRLVMWLEVDDAFSFERMAALESTNSDVQAWETAMWRHQQALPGAPAGSKWQPMAPIYALEAAR